MRDEAEDAQACQNRRLTVKDAPAMMGLYLQIEEFAPSYRNPEKTEEQLVTDLEKGELAVGLFLNQKLVSLAKTSASNSLSAMVVGVATAPDARRKG